MARIDGEQLATLDLIVNNYDQQAALIFKYADDQPLMFIDITTAEAILLYDKIGGYLNQIRDQLEIQGIR